MKFETAFDCGDKGWTYRSLYGEVSRVQEVTVGQIRIEHTDTILYEDDETGYGEPTFIHKEIYMCKETGVGSGSLLTYGEHIFKTREECEAKFADVIAKQKQDKLDKVENEKKRKLAQEASLRLQLAEIEKIKEGM